MGRWEDIKCGVTITAVANVSILHVGRSLRDNDLRGCARRNDYSIANFAPLGINSLVGKTVKDVISERSWMNSAQNVCDTVYTEVQRTRNAKY